MLVYNIASAIKQQNKTVLLIDNDPQSSLTQIMRVDVNGKPTIKDLYQNKNVTLHDTIIRYDDHISLIPNIILSSTLESDLHNRMTREMILKQKMVPGIADYVIIDNSPFLGLCVKNSLAMSDYYIEIIDNSVSAIMGLDLVENVVQEIKENYVNPDLKRLGIVRNRFDKRTNYTKQLNQFMQTKYESHGLFNTIINDSIKYREATLAGQLIHDYNRPLACCYDQLLLEINERLGV